MKLLCRLNLHNWSMWTDPFEEKWLNVRTVMGISTATKDVVRTFISRRCQDCREYEKKEIK